MSPEPSLVLDDVRAGYGVADVLRGVSLAVRPGEVVGLVGPNGCGKTTLVRVASRALKPSAGSVLVAGRDPYDLSSKEAARLVAVVPQDVVPAFLFDVLEFVLMGRAPYCAVDRRRPGGLGEGAGGDGGRGCPAPRRPADG